MTNFYIFYVGSQKASRLGVIVQDYVTAFIVYVLDEVTHPFDALVKFGRIHRPHKDRLRKG